MDHIAFLSRRGKNRVKRIEFSRKIEFFGQLAVQRMSGKAQVKAGNPEKDHPCACSTDLVDHGPEVLFEFGSGPILQEIISAMTQEDHIRLIPLQDPGQALESLSGEFAGNAGVVHSVSGQLRQNGRV